MNGQYLFTSERLGFRNWEQADIPLMAEINADPDVMEFFPGTKNHEETAAFIERMQLQLADNGYCYFAVDKLEDRSFIGFIGLSEQAYEASFTPCTDIGWRLSKKYWGKGYATEGAVRCLEYAFSNLKIKKVLAVAPKINVRSELVMQKAGMRKVEEFIHPLLLNDERLRECVLYEMANDAQVV
ncbi:MAG: acetyltransferase, ribosomal protein N-acetylase [Flavipsychrobacter sp.]|nr:acetyltransferase, ribosomal protein N-acetylase [Flavipsychrobacter sp.]